ncbi:hypothetical protein K3495_g3090 [Podosphaera aphanis]|nr:hypothetical protein K3495_g3090 [Podosphaera aphanis]
MKQTSRLQVAQIIADLQSLQTAPPQAALALLNMRSIPTPQQSCRKTENTTEIVELISKNDGLGHTNIDMERAKSLVDLYETKERFSQISDTGLTLAKQRVDAIAAKFTEIHACSEVEKRGPLS